MDFGMFRAFQDWLTAREIPGNDCMIMQDHRVLYRYMSGYADLESERPIRGDELYYFWSASKPITACLALRLLERGAFRLDDPLADYMPEFSHMLIRSPDASADSEPVPAKKPILIRHLFTMTASFSYRYNLPEIEAVKRATNGRCPTREVARGIARTTLYFEPGEKWDYCFCHDILGALVEVVSGRRLRDFAADELFRPLGMTDTSYNLPKDPKKLARMATQYAYLADENRVVPTDGTCGHIIGPEYDCGGAGVVSTCSDYMKFADAIANEGLAKNGYRVLKPETVRLWKTDALAKKQRRSMSYWPHMAGYSYGLGVRTMIDPAAGHSLGPVGEFGWDGAAGTFVLFDTENRLACVYTQHMLYSDWAHIFPTLRNLVYACLEKPDRI